MLGILQRKQRRPYYKPNTALYQHQREGIEYLVSHENVGLFDTMGLGKTLQILCAAKTLLDENKIDAAVVVCKRQHVPVWLGEIKQFCSTLPTYSVVGKSPKVREELWPVEQRGIFFMSYSLLSRSLASKAEYDPNTMLKLSRSTIVKGADAINLANLLDKKRVLLILDESQYIANHKAKVTRVLHSLGRMATRRIIATGTPVAERPDNLWSQIYFLDQGELLGRSYYEFINRYAVFAGHSGKRWIVRYTNLTNLRKHVEKISIRRTKEQCLDLPPKIFMPTYHTPKGDQAKALREERENMKDALQRMKTGNIQLQRGSSFSYSLQRMQILAAIPSVIEYDVKQSAKIDALLDLLESIGEDERVVVWSVHKRVAEAVADVLNLGHGVTATIIHGGVEHRRRTERLEQFKRGKFRVLSATMATLREGVSIAEASHAFYIQRDFSLTNWLQSQDRHHRLTTTKTVVVHTPILHGSIDAYIHKHLEEKSADAITSIDNDVTVTLDKASLLATLKRSSCT